MPLDAVALGELLIDFSHISTDGDGYPTLSAHPGGAPANYLAALAKLGAKTAMIAKVGADSFGALLSDTLEKAGISTEGIVADEAVFTTLAFVTFDEERNRHFSFARKPGADVSLKSGEVDTALIDDAKVFHFGTLSLTGGSAKEATEFAVDNAKSRGKLISFDPNLRIPLWSDLDDAKEKMRWGLRQAEVVKISDDEVRFLFGALPYEDAAEKILEDYNARLVFVTTGKEGCVFANQNCCGHSPALSGLKVTDTTGAGDIFGGSAMYKLLETGEKPEKLEYEQLKEIADFACIAAGLSTEKPGGISSVPTMTEIQRALAARG